jgi:hypothetical protein
MHLSWFPLGGSPDQSDDGGFDLRHLDRAFLQLEGFHAV